MEPKKNMTLSKNKLLLIIAGSIIALGIIFLAINFQTPVQNSQQNLENPPLVLTPKKFSQIEPTQELTIENNQKLDLSADIVEREINGEKSFGFGYNKQSPGPLLRVKQGSGIIVDFKNNLEMPTTVHWHGLRLDNKFDGVPEVTQKEVLPGDSFEYQLKFPDAGLFWYHPHVREDYQQELGLYGAILVEPQNNKENYSQKEVLIIDDILLQNNKPFEFMEKTTNFAAMGRYGNTLLANGKTNYLIEAAANKILKLYVLNAANARPIKLAIEGVRLKIIGSDASEYENLFFSDYVIIAPSERAIIEVFFENKGEYLILNDAPFSKQVFGKIVVNKNESIDLTSKIEFEALQENLLVKEEIDKLKPFFDKEPDFEYELLIEWPVMDAMMAGRNMMGMHTGPDGIEWEDSMQRINEITTSDEITWVIRDAKTKQKNMDFFQTVKKGDIKKIRIRNILHQSHPMQHPIHLHGNRFLVLSKDGVPNPNLAWKDTVLVPSESTVDILVEFSNPGDWMLHCHIAEHLSSNMMTMIKVEEGQG